MGKSLVIVESPAKARTIAGYLGSDYVLGSSVGHIRDLPNRASDVPAAQRINLIVLLISRLSFGSASAATFSIISILAGLSASGRHISVTQLIPNTRSPA